MGYWPSAFSIRFSHPQFDRGNNVAIFIHLAIDALVIFHLEKDFTSVTKDKTGQRFKIRPIQEKDLNAVVEIEPQKTLGTSSLGERLF